MTVGEIMAKPFWTIQEAAVMTGYKTSYLYLLTHRREIPHNKRGRRVIFERDVLLAWCKGEKVKTAEELATEAATVNELKK